MRVHIFSSGQRMKANMKLPYIYAVVQAGRIKRRGMKVPPEDFARAVTRVIEAGADNVIAWSGNVLPIKKARLAEIGAIYNEFWRIGKSRKPLPVQKSSMLAAAGTAIMRGQHSTALAILVKLAKAQPGNPAAWAGMSRAYEGMGHTQQGISVAKRAVLEDPLNPEWRERLGLAYKAGKRYSEAIIDVLTRLLSSHPDLPASQYALAAAYVISGKTAYAHEPLKKACELDPRLREKRPKDPDFEPVWNDTWFSLLKAEK